MKGSQVQSDIDAVVLQKLIDAGEKGISILDFNESDGVTEEMLASSIQRLRYGIFESPDDGSLNFDS